jgi:hypothetical protein
LDSRTSILGLRFRVLCSRTAFFCALSDGLGARHVVPQDELDAGHLRIHRNFIAILLLPLVLLAALAAGRIRSNVTQGVRAGRVNTLTIWRR